MTPVERLEKLAEKATTRPWGWFGAGCGCQFIKQHDGSESGGEFITSLDDNVREADVEIIVAAVNALPALLKVARALYAESCINGGKVHCWKEAGGESPLPREDWCGNCVALEPLFREQSAETQS